MKDLRHVSSNWAKVNMADDVGMAYVALGYWVAAISHFTLGYRMLKPSSEGEGEGADRRRYVRLEEVEGAAGLGKEEALGHSAVTQTGIDTLAVEVQQSNGPGASGGLPGAVAGQPSTALVLKEGLKSVGRSSSSGGVSTGRHNIAVVVHGGSDAPAARYVSARVDEELFPRANDHPGDEARPGRQLQLTMMIKGPRDYFPLGPSGPPPSGTDSDPDLSQNPQLDGQGSWWGVWKSAICQGGLSIRRDLADPSTGGEGSWCWQQALPLLLHPLASLTKDLLTPPILGCLAAFIIGAIPWLKTALFEPTGQLRMLGDINKMLGQCYIPTLLMLLGATLEEGPGSAQVPVRVIIGVTLTRLVVLPLLGTAYLMAAFLTGVFHPPDPIFMLVMLIQNSMPIALNVQTLTVIHQYGQKEMSCLIFWGYLATIITLPLFLMLYLYLSATYFIPQ